VYRAHLTRNETLGSAEQEHRFPCNQCNPKGKPPQKNKRIEEITRALTGAGELPDHYLSEGAVWERTEGTVLGRAAIQATRANLPRCDVLHIDQIVSQGKVSTASGLVTRPGQGTRLFCHVIRFTSPSAQTVAQVVSFEHAERKNVR
jgi:hypothetical protein